jgi:hypothetical protein
MENGVFRCNVCNYSTKHRGDLKKHCTTLKHITAVACGLPNDDEHTKVFSCECGKKFKHLRSLSRHRPTCGDGESVATLTDAVKTLVEENRKLSSQLKELVPNDSQIAVHNGGVTNHISGDYQPQYITAIKDSQINMQLFLDEKCSQAVNLTTFIETLRLNSEDLDETRERGLAYSLGKVLIRGLRELELNKRPIHCSNLRKSVMYVRDNDAWGLDTRETQIRNAIGRLSTKQVGQITEWEMEHPDWDKTDAGKQLYAETVHKIFQVARDADKERIENQVIKTIARETLVD